MDDLEQKKSKKPGFIDFLDFLGLYRITKWRRGWDSNPRGGMNRQPDFESGALQPDFATSPQVFLKISVHSDDVEKNYLTWNCKFFPIPPGAPRNGGYSKTVHSP